MESLGIYGLHDPFHMHDRVWYLSVPKSFFDDAMSAGPFEFLTAISFSFEYVLTNLLFMPFMSGAAHNGDMATVTCHRQTKRRWKGLEAERPPEHVDKAFISRSTIVMVKEGGDWKAIHAHFSEASPGARPGGI